MPRILGFVALVFWPLLPLLAAHFVAKALIKHFHKVDAEKEKICRMARAQNPQGFWFFDSEKFPGGNSETRFSQGL